MFPSSVFFAIFFINTAFSQNDCQKNRLNSVKTGEQIVRGTNLGSWFVLESWMVPSLWEKHNCSRRTQDGSYLFEKCLGDRAKPVMEQHWATFITENDFAEMSKSGVNAVRLPVGWWHVS